MPVRRHPVAAIPPDGRSGLFPLDAALVSRLKAAYAQVRTADPSLAEIFYAKLFSAAPQLRPMFRDSAAAQAKKLTDALDFVVLNLEHPTTNAVMIADMGVRHAGYGAKPEHYDLVIDLLITSMREALGPGADPRALDDWRMSLRLIANQMIAAADKHPSHPQADAIGRRPNHSRPTQG